MVRAVEYRDLHVHNGIARDHAGLHRFLNTFVHGRNVFARHSAPDNSIDELVALAGRQRLELEPYVSVLAPPAGLANEFAFGFDGVAQRFAVSNLGLADIRFNLEFALHAIDDDFQVQLAHAFDDGLP